jgi:hypothetical protein
MLPEDHQPDRPAENLTQREHRRHCPCAKCDAEDRHQQQRTTAATDRADDVTDERDNDDQQILHAFRDENLSTPHRCAGF